MDVQLCERLLEERKRLGLTQEQMAKAGGVVKRTYCNYEAGEREPSSSFLASIKAAGVDIGYLLFGVMEIDDLGTTPSESRLLNLYRQCSDDNKNALEAMALALANPELAGTFLRSAERISAAANSAPVVNGDGNHIAGRDMVVGARRGKGKK